MGRHGFSRAGLRWDDEDGAPRRRSSLPVRVMVWTRSAPEGDDGGQSEGRGVVAGEFVVASGNAAEVFEAVEVRLDPPALPIAWPVWRIFRLRPRLPGMIGMMPLLRGSARSQSAS